jgi:hypothetical protein
MAGKITGQARSCRRWTFRLAGRDQPRGRRWAVSALLGAGALAISFLAGVAPADAIVGGTPLIRRSSLISLLFPAGCSASALAR